jgi:tellurite resistance protein TerC
MEVLFPFAEYWHIYAGFLAFVLAMLALDLGVFHRDAHEVSFKEALSWSAIWITLALVFNYGFYLYVGEKFGDEQIAKRLGLEFLTGFLVEKSLAVDNIFVFVLVFNFFAIPLKYQHRVLFYGILGALFFRAIFIALGSVLMQYHAVVLFFGVLLIITGIKILVFPDKQPDLAKNPVINFLKRVLPLTDKLHGQSFVAVENGKRVFTPLFLALMFVEFSDIIFAVDSVPAIFAITSEPLIVFTSNIFAILGLRSLYFLLANVVHRFRYLKTGLGLILTFVGLKMVWLNELYGGKFPIGMSLGIIGGILLASILASVLIKSKEPAK